MPASGSARPVVSAPSMSDLASSSDVLELAELARGTGRLCIDTEFMGEGRYRTLLCLVQVAVEVGDDVRIEVLDPLDEALDFGPLADALADPAIEIVMHAGRQDVALLRRVWSTDITNLFDTQLAAGFAGLRAQLGYEALLHELLGVRLAKSASFTRWDARPLSAEQVDYARDDVRHLLQATTVLQERLEQLGRLEWAREECRVLALATDERDPDVIFARLPRVNSLDPKLRAIARELVVWREEAARTQDRPIPTVLSDAALIEVAKRRPSAIGQLEQIRGINEPTLRRRGARSSRPSHGAASGRRSPSKVSARRSRARSTHRSSRSPRRSCARARWSASSPTSSSPRARTCRRSCSRHATADRCRTCARCRAGGVRSSATSCWSCSRAGAR